MTTTTTTTNPIDTHCPPPACNSYEDNEVRAISASKEIILAFQGLQLGASIGITTGQVYCGFVGASKRCEYAMMGCSVNLSARLMASAPKNTIQVRG